MGFFVDRPVFATVIALIIALVGALSLKQLAIEQYPNVAPPQVKVTAVYPGASPELLENVVAAPLEREMNGVSGLLYMYSTSSSSGLMELYVVFQPGVDLDIATVEVNNRVKRVEALLPQVVLQNGVKVDKTNPAILLILTMQSKTGQFDRDYISNLANSSVVPEIKRIAGVGDVLLFGSPYAMRVWLNPDLLTKYKLTVNDVANAIREQNQNYAVGEIGTAPSATGQVLTFPVQTGGTFTEPEQFANIIVRAAADGSVVRVRDVARVELGADDYQVSMRLNGKPATGIGVYLRPGGNALETADQVRAKMQQLSASIPSDIEWRAPYDTTVFVKASIELVVHTFIEAFVLVLIVVYLFLGSVRATIIPLLAIPVSLVGTAAGHAADGLLDQHADAVRAGAGDRHRRRRRDRGRRGGREDHARQGPRTARGRARGDEGHRQRHRRRHGGDLRGVRPDRVPRRRDGHAVQAVRGHDHDLDAAVGDHRADAHPGAVRADPEEGHAQAEADPGVRPLLRPGDRRATPAPSAGSSGASSASC